MNMHARPPRAAGTAADGTLGVRPARRPLWRSASARFALLQFLLSLACTLPVIFYIYHKVDGILLADFTRPLEFRLSNLEKHHAKGGIAELRTAVGSRAERAHRDQTAILLADADGHKLAGNLTAWPDAVAATQDWAPASLQRDGVSHAEEMIFGALIVWFLVVEPHGLARLWSTGRQKLRLWPFPH